MVLLCALTTIALSAVSTAAQQPVSTLDREFTVEILANRTRTAFVNKSSRIIELILINASGSNVDIGVVNTVTDQPCLLLEDAKITSKGSFILMSVDTPCKIVITTQNAPATIKIMPLGADRD